MSHYDVVESYDTTIDIAGRKIGATVKYATLQEYEPVDVSFGDDAADAEYIARFASEELFNVCIRVRVSALGLDGDDFLGACHVRASNFEFDVRQTAAANGMIANATEELKNKLLKIAMELQK